MVKWHSVAALLVFAACSPAGPGRAAPLQAPRLEQIWRLGGLANPESVALSADGTFLYVSNVSGEGEAKDGNGFIARVSTDGRMLQHEFAVGLNGPKGVVLLGDALYVADIDRVVVIDANTGAIRDRLPGRFVPSSARSNRRRQSPDCKR